MLSQHHIFRLSLHAILTSATTVFCPLSTSGQTSNGRILFDSDQDGRAGLYQMNADGSNATLLHEQGGAATFSRDGSKIAFIGFWTENGTREIYVMNADGTGVTRITDSGEPPVPDRDLPGPVIIGPESVSFHPVGDRVVFADRGEIFVVSIDGDAVPQKLSVPEGTLTDKESPVFSPDGERILFAGLTEAETEPDSGIFTLNWDIYSIGGNGTGLIRLTDHPGTDVSPKYNPDGSRIVFTRQDDASAGIYTMSSSGGEASRITSNANLTVLTAAFSPDGSRIVFDAIGNESAVTDIFVVGTNGAGLIKLTDGVGFNANPVWGPGSVAPTLRVTTVNERIAEGNSGGADAVFSVRLSSPSSQPVTIHVRTANGTAIAGEDFVEQAEVITLAPGEVERTIRVPITGDTEWEASETFFFEIGEAQGASVSVPRATAVILNDDAIPVVPGRLVFTSYANGNGDIFVMNPDGSATYNLTNTPDISETSPVWSPDGSKIAFVASGGEGSGSTGQFNDIYVINANGTGRGRLTNTPLLSEYSPSWSPDGSQIVFESNGQDEFDGGVIPNFDFQLYVMDANGRGRNRITKGSLGFPMQGKNPVWAATGKIYFVDYQNGASHIMTVNPNGTGQRSLFNVPDGMPSTLGAPAVSPDGSKIAFMQLFTTEEGGEQYDVMLINASGSGLVNLTQDPAFDVDPGFSPEGNTIIFSSNREGDFDLYSVPVPADEQAGRTVVRSSLSQRVSSRVPALRLTSATGDERDADWDRRNSAIPTNIQISIGKRVIGEGQKTALFTVRLSRPAKGQVSLQYTTVDGSAKAGSDYTAQSGTLTFFRGQRSKTIRVPIINDSVDEENETFSLRLSSLGEDPITTAQGTILDDDRPPRIVIQAIQVAEPADGTAQASFTVQLSAISARPVTVSYHTKDGTAKSASDYNAVNGTLSFLPGEQVKSVIVEIIADAIPERTETLFLEIGSAQNARGKGLRGRATIE